MPRVRFALFALLAASILAACAAPGSSREQLGSTTPAGAIAAWRHYRSVHDLVAGSDLIVVGVVTAKVGERVMTEGRVPPAVTEFEVAVRSTLKGPERRLLTVVQLGREGDPANTYADFPLLRVGTDVVLFLNSAPSDNPGVAKFSISSPEGAYIVSSGQLRSISNESLLVSTLDGKSVAELQVLIAQNVR